MPDFSVFVEGRDGRVCQYVLWRNVVTLRDSMKLRTKRISGHYTAGGPLL